MQPGIKKKLLSANQIIRKSLAGFLLVVFAFGITPKRVLHNLVANHKDGRPSPLTHQSDGAAFSKAFFNCQCDNLISESPFVAQENPAVANPVLVFQEWDAVVKPGPVSSAPLSFGLRGPPAC